MIKSNSICRRCGGRYRDHGGSVDQQPTNCPVTNAMLDALRAFRAERGVRWRSRLIGHWTQGDDLGPELRRVRNIVGPTELYRINLEEP